MDEQGYNAIEFDSTITKIDQFVFSECEILTNQAIGTQLIFSSSIEEIGYGAFYECFGITQVDLSAATEVILERSSFRYCENLTKVNISSATTVTFAGHVFEKCYDLMNVNLSSATAVTFGEASFEYCENLTQVTLASSAEITIDEYAFNECTALLGFNNASSITIASIGDYAFGDCASLTVPGINFASVEDCKKSTDTANGIC
jgi:hypothetical protein